MPSSRQIASGDIAPFFEVPTLRLIQSLYPILHKWDIRQHSRPTLANPTGGPVNIMDGQSHPLSQHFLSVSDAQQVFPMAASLSEELANHCLQKVVSEIGRLKNNNTQYVYPEGGRAWIPAGIALMGNRCIVVPDTISDDFPHGWVGEDPSSKFSTVLFWNVDVSTHGQWCVKKAKRHSRSKFVMEGTWIKGPGGDPGRGNQPCFLRGVAMSGRWELVNCNITNLFCAFGIWDDHCVFRSNNIGAGCFFGGMFDEDLVALETPGQTMDYGDHLFFNTNMGGCLKAVWCICASNQMEHSQFYDCHMGYSPINFYRPPPKKYISDEPNTVRPGITNTSFFPKCQAEAVGNAFYYSENFADDRDKIDKVTFRDIQFYFNGDYADASEKWVFKLNATFNSDFIGPHLTFGGGGIAGTLPAGRAVFECVLQSCTFDKGFYSLIMEMGDVPLVGNGQPCLFVQGKNGEQFEFDARTINANVDPGTVMAAFGYGAGPIGSTGRDILGVIKAVGVSGRGYAIINRGVASPAKVAGIGTAIAAGERVVVDPGGTSKVRGINSASPIFGIVGRAVNGADDNATYVDIEVAIVNCQTTALIAAPPDREFTGSEVLAKGTHLRKRNRATGSGNKVITVPTQATAPYPLSEPTNFMRYGTGEVTFAPASGVTINPPGTLRINAQYQYATLEQIAPDEWLLTGALKA